jgi:hypothetical protein
MAVAAPERRTAGRIKRAPEDWTAAGWAGLIGALVFLALEAGPLLWSGDPVKPLRMIAAIAYKVLPVPSDDPRATFLAALAVHVPLSLIYARILAYFIKGRPLGRAVAQGALFGLALYVVNFYFFVEAFPWFKEARHPKELLDHVIFGMVVAYSYRMLEDKRAFPPGK